MFIQIIRAKVADRQRARDAEAAWMRDLAPGATGWLGSTSGVTDDGQLFVMARFESEEAAKANSSRPEQDQWWSEFSRSLDGEATFQDSTNVYVQAVGDLDAAGFVQVMTGQTNNPDRALELMDASRDARQANRPDILGSCTVGHGDGKFTMVIYFESEEAARRGEQQPIPPEMQATMTEMMSLAVGMPEYLDLKQPSLDSPATVGRKKVSHGS